MMRGRVGNRRSDRVPDAPLYDNDYGDPDFSGYFDVCNGLTVPPAEFIAKIGLADEAAEARYPARMSRR